MEENKNRPEVRTDGLTDAEVAQSRIKHGENMLTPPVRVSLWRLYIDKYNDPIIKILLVAAGVSLGLAFKGVEGVELAMPCVSDNALAIFDSREMPITLKGVVPTLYPGLTKIDSIVAGGTRIATLPPDRVVISVGVAHQLGVYESDEP